MSFRTLVLGAALSLMSFGGATAQTAAPATSVAGGLRAATVRQFEPSPIASYALRGGAMVTPRGAGLVGVDATIPSLSLGEGWVGRIDADVIFKANLGGVNTIVPVTIDQIRYSTPLEGTTSTYVGAGLGAVLSGPARFDGKLVIGADFAQRLGAEVNVHFTEDDTLVTVLARLRF